MKSKDKNMETQIYGYKCLLCGDIIYRRSRWDGRARSCRCGNIYFYGYYKFNCVIEGKYEDVRVELGEGVDQNVLERDEAGPNGVYGIIESEISDDDLNKIKTKILLLEK